MPKTKAKAKVKAKTARVETPDWLRKAMAPSKTKQKPGPRPKAVKEKFKATKRGRKPMVNISKDKPLADPFDDPDLKAGTKDAPKTEKPKSTPLTVEAEPEPAPLFDEVQSGAEIPPENVEALIAGTLGGGGDAHANAKRIMRRMYEAPPAGAGWQTIKALDAGSGDTLSRSGRKPDASHKPDDRKDDERKDNKR